MDIRRALLLRKFLIRLKVAMVFFWSRNTTICTQSCQANWLSFAIPSSLNCLWSSTSLASAPSSVRKYAQLLVGGNFNARLLWIQNRTVQGDYLGPRCGEFESALEGFDLCRALELLRAAAASPPSPAGGDRSE